jgi:hypothetical protein
MPISTKVTFSNGEEHEVLRVPPYALRRVGADHPLPDLPEPDAPDFEERVAEVNALYEARGRLLHETSLLMALPDVEVPEDWAFPRGLRHGGVEPRQGENGTWLDYVEYGLLRTQEDIEALQDAMHGKPLSREEVTAAEETFQPQDSEVRDAAVASAAPDTG